MDNLNDLVTKKNAVHDPTAAPQSILVTEVNDFEQDVITKLGRYSGFFFVSKRNPEVTNVIQAASIYWGANAMNRTTNFQLKFAQLTADGNSFKRVLSLMSAGDFIKLKDFNGKSTTLQLVGYEEALDANSNPYQIVTVFGFAENTDYVYQVADAVPCMVEFITKSGASLSLTDYDQKFEAAGGTETFTVPANMKNVRVVINEGRILQQTEGEFSYVGTNLNMLRAADTGDKVYISGIY